MFAVCDFSAVRFVSFRCPCPIRSPPLSLFSSDLKLERDTAHGSTSLDTLHQVSDESCDLVTKALRWDDGDLLGDLLVGIKIESQLSEILLDHDARSALNQLRANATLRKSDEQKRRDASIWNPDVMAIVWIPSAAAVDGRGRWRQRRQPRSVKPIRYRKRQSHMIACDHWLLLVRCC